MTGANPHSKEFPSAGPFGTAPGGIRLQERPGAYAIIPDGTGRIAIMGVRGSHFLPGGGLEGGDDPESALIREVREEMGWSCRVDRLIGKARQIYHGFDGTQWFGTDGYFFVVELIRPRTAPVEADHRLYWVEPDAAVQVLRHEFQRWAVGRWIGTR